MFEKVLILDLFKLLRPFLGPNCFFDFSVLDEHFMKLQELFRSNVIVLVAMAST